MKVAVIIPTIGSRIDSMVRALLSAVCQEIVPSDIIIIFQGDAVAYSKLKSKITSFFPNCITCLHFIYSYNFLSPAIARNKGLSHAVSLGVDYVAFLDDDDLWLPCHLSRALNSLQRSAASFYSSSSLGMFFILGYPFFYPTPFKTREGIWATLFPLASLDSSFIKSHVSMSEYGCLPSWVFNLHDLVSEFKTESLFGESHRQNEDLFLALDIHSSSLKTVYAPFSFSVVFRAPLPHLLSNSNSHLSHTPKFVHVTLSFIKYILSLARAIPFRLSLFNRKLLASARKIVTAQDFSN